MGIRLARRHLSYTDRAGETAFAVIMVMIINGYVSLSKLNSGFLYIVVLTLVLARAGVSSMVSSTSSQNRWKETITERSFFC